MTLTVHRVLVKHIGGFFLTNLVLLASKNGAGTQPRDL